VLDFKNQLEPKLIKKIKNRGSTSNPVYSKTLITIVKLARVVLVRSCQFKKSCHVVTVRSSRFSARLYMYTCYYELYVLIDGSCAKAKRAIKREKRKHGKSRAKGRSQCCVCRVKANSFHRLAPSACTVHKGSDQCTREDERTDAIAN
jgi:hypothetical protein